MSTQQTAVKSDLPTELRPMMARLGREAFDSRDYLFELDWDGIRALAFLENGTLKLKDRKGNDITRIFPELSSIPSQLGIDKVIIDGEIVCLDSDSHPNFQMLEQRLAKPSRAKIPRNRAHFIAYDVLYVNGRSVMDKPLITRKNVLHKLIKPGNAVQIADCIEKEGKAFFAATCEHGLEGIVAKLKVGQYQSDKRTSEWLKIKRVRHGEFVIGGYTFDGNKQEPVKSLLLGLYENDRLIFVGQVSSGLGQHSKRMSSLLKSLHTDTSPFKQAPRIQNFSFWCRPELVCQVGYGEFTEVGRLVYPVFEGLRGDSVPQECQTFETLGWPRPIAGLA